MKSSKTWSLLGVGGILLFGGCSSVQECPLRPVAGACSIGADRCFGQTGLYSSLGGTDKTHFVCGMTETDFVFRFEVQDEHIYAAKVFTSKRVVAGTDRVELFFSPTPTLDGDYYCAEIDPLGRVMDYKAKLYRKFDMTWAFKTMKTQASVIPGGYAVSGSVSKQELVNLGIDPGKFGLGVFRGDFDQEGKLVGWCSAAPMPDFRKPDFHKPDVFFWYR